jgi:hypothetical protein
VPRDSAAAPSFVDTPALLRRWNLLAVATVVAFGVLSAVVQLVGWQSDGRAAGDTDQLVRVQGIESSLLRADALATNGYLLAGLEPTDRQHEYDQAIDGVLRQIADAAEAQPADRTALAALNQQVEQYAANVAQAAVYDRIGYPVGIAYQTTASVQLRDQTKPILEALVKANSQRSTDAMGGQHPTWLLLVGVLALVSLVLINRQMAQAFRRRINTGLAIAAAIVLVTTLVTAVAALLHARANHSTQHHAYREAVAAATARTAANDAKAIESLRLINRGAGTTWEPQWAAARAVVETTAPADRSSWRTYVQRHEQVVHLDNSNQWKRAVVLATSSDDKVGTSKPLDDFDHAMERLSTSEGAKASRDLRSGRDLALALGILTALLGVVAAVAVNRGIGERQKEFL